MVEELKIRNLTLNDECTMNMEDADYLLYEGGIDWGSLGVSHNTFQYSQQVGQSITNTVVGTRDISIGGWIIGKTLDEIKAKKKRLSAIVNPLNDVEVEQGKWKIKCRPAANVVFSNSYVENNDTVCKFLIQLFCPNPMFESSTTYGKKLMQDEAMFKFPWVLPRTGIVMSTRQASSIVAINNTGSAEVGCTITLQALGDVNNPEVVNLDTSEFIKIKKNLVYGEVITIKTAKGERSVVGHIGSAEDINYLDYFDFDNTWLQLPVGVSNIGYRTFDNEGNEDTTYKSLVVTIQYNLSTMNLEDE